MIPKRFHFHTFSFFMSLFMSGVMSLAMLFAGSTSWLEALSDWPAEWALAMLVAFPTSMLVVPITQRLVSRIVIHG